MQSGQGDQMAETRVKKAAPDDGLPGCSEAVARWLEPSDCPPASLMDTLSSLAAPRQAAAAAVRGEVTSVVGRSSAACLSSHSVEIAEVLRASVRTGQQSDGNRCCGSHTRGAQDSCYASPGNLHSILPQNEPSCPFSKASTCARSKPAPQRKRRMYIRMYTALIRAH